MRLTNSVISSVTPTTYKLDHTHTSASSSGTATVLTGVKGNGTVDAYTSLTTATAKTVNSVGTLPTLSYTDNTVEGVSE